MEMNQAGYIEKSTCSLHLLPLKIPKITFPCSSTAVRRRKGFGLWWAFCQQSQPGNARITSNCKKEEKVPVKSGKSCFGFEHVKQHASSDPDYQSHAGQFVRLFDRIIHGTVRADGRTAQIKQPSDTIDLFRTIDEHRQILFRNFALERQKKIPFLKLQ